MKRRSFLKNTSAFALPAFMGGFEMAAMDSRSLFNLINGDSDKVLVLIDLNGGNDGLASFVPLDGYDNLANARSNIIIPQNQLLTMTDTIGLHPSMSNINQLFDNGNLALVQGVAYPDQNRSHFRSADIWNTGVKADEYKPTGWLGRHLDMEYPGYPGDYPTEECPDPFAITLGKSISGTCQGMNSNFSIAILDAENLGGLTTGIEVPLPDDCYGEELGYLIETFKQTNAYGGRVIDAATAGNSIQNYPQTELAQQLRIVSLLISGGLQSKIYVLKLGGFDLHADQIVQGSPALGAQAQLMQTLSDAIYAFQEDIKALGLEDRVLGMTFSEFGRKIKSNAGHGTDHGTAAPMMFFGSCINPGIIGNNPFIAPNVDIEEGVAMQYDFKSVYGSVLMDWFDVPEEQVREFLIEDFQHIPIINDCNSVSTTEPTAILDLSVSAYPNPFLRQMTVEIKLEKSAAVRIDVADVMGKIVGNITNRTLSEGPHQLLVDGRDWAMGIYFVRIQVGQAVKTVRIIKQ